MSEFKFACPVCGQHITADSSASGSQLDCPTCFRKIVVPQAPAAETKLLLSATQPGDSLLRFPVVQGKNLEGRSFHLPHDFEGDMNIVVVAFQRHQQAAVDTWMPALTWS